jgi:hypothetical protein
MKSVLLFILASLVTLSSRSQSTLAYEKSAIFGRIIDKIVNGQSGLKVFVMLDMRYYRLRASSGVAGTVINLSRDMLEDTLAFVELQKRFSKETDKKEMTLRTFSELSFPNREQVIDSYDFLDDTASLQKNKIFIEIKIPIDGWESASLFLHDKVFSENNTFMKYQIPRICIPVFVYSLIGNTEKTSLLLFRFEMNYSDHKFSTHLIDIRPL